MIAQAMNPLKEGIYGKEKDCGDWSK